MLACNLTAFAGDERVRYQTLTLKLKEAIESRRELPDGYELTLRPAGIAHPEVTEWIGLESRCCPFLTFQFHAPSLTLTGPDGVKQILAAVFG